MSYLEISFPEVKVEEIENRLALDILNALPKFKSINGTVKFRKGGDVEIILFNLELSTPNNPKVDIRVIEPIAISVHTKIERIPKVYALRTDFPENLSHTNTHENTHPIDLCIYEELFSEAKLSWSGIGFLHRVREWFELTSKGKLHQEDQPLETFLIGKGVIVYDSEKIEKSNYLIYHSEILSRIVTEKQLNEDAFIKKHEFSYVTYISKDMVHNVVNVTPKNLKALLEIFSKAEIDLEEHFLEIGKSLINGDAQNRFNKKITVVFVCNLKRGDDDIVEEQYVYFIKFDLTIGEILEKAGYLFFENSQYFPIVGGKIDLKKCGEIGLDILNSHQEFTYKRAKELSGINYDKNISLIGVGALGSPFLNNLIRQGVGKWDVFDHDNFSPHNLMRHILDRTLLGQNKAEAISHHVNNVIFPIEKIIKPHPINILDISKESTEYKILENSEIIVDISTSIPVQRHLTSLFPDKKKISAFLNPNGNQLVVLEEDQSCKYSLDLLEYQFYSKLLDEEDLQSHYDYNNGKIRYARGCRDVTSKISQSNISIFSGILSNHFVQNLSSEGGVKIWALNQDYSVNIFHYGAEEWISCGVHSEWLVHIKEKLLKEMQAFRIEKLPNETGGILVGGVDTYHKSIYITDTIKSPNDSTERPTIYIRGIEGVEKKLQKISKITNSNLEYLGEWHSHPDGCSTNMSTDDMILFTELIEEGEHRGLPSIMFILGEMNQSLYIGNI